MKICKIIYKIILIALIIIMSTSCICYADDETGQREGEKTERVQGDDSKMLPTLDESYKPSVEDSTKVKSVIADILSILIVLGIIAIVVGVVMIGYSTILGSASGKAVSQERYVGLVIAALIIVGGSVIAKMIISVAEGI